MTTTSIHLGQKASKAAILQAFDYDESMVEVVKEEFDDLAESNGSDAVLCVFTSTATVPVDELDDDFPYDSWLEGAYEAASERWMSGE